MTNVGLVRCSNNIHPENNLKGFSNELGWTVKNMVVVDLRKEEALNENKKSMVVKDTEAELAYKEAEMESQQDAQQGEPIDRSSPSLTNTNTETTRKGEGPEVTGKMMGNLQLPMVEDRRTSSRLQKDILLTTEDRILKIGKKRNLEGTNLNTKNSFSVLDNTDTMHISSEMGILIEDSNYAAIDMIKYLEIARYSLAKKRLLQKMYV